MGLQEQQHLGVAAGGAGVVQRADVAAGGERLAACSGDHDAPHRRIVAPILKLHGQRPHHAERHSVECLRPVQRDEARGASAREQNFGLCRIHR